MTKKHAVYRRDYKKPDYLIPQTVLAVDIYDDHTRVKNSMTIESNRDDAQLPPLKLDGVGLALVSVALDHQPLGSDEYRVDDSTLTINVTRPRFELEVVVDIHPDDNKELEGLYRSGPIYCTQNEPEGFRHITYFLDRPDVMSRYETTISADKEVYPQLLSNGNPVDQGDLDDSRHFVSWSDPFPKPCYLFALVAGDLDVLEDSFVTRSNREIQLRIFVDKGNLSRAGHAMTSLKKAMKWDEDTFGLECDLDNYMVVAVDAFNFGAMENKGLNIFNSQYVLADPVSATDTDFQRIEGVIGHEYFHNWTGNRVTCRDWFQLTLKEGLTVFRDQEFSSDMNSRAVKRISDVRVLRDHQFSEDAGPMKHPVRPESYLEINNFYTATVYNKGAEVVRMIHTLVGKEAFRKGIETYFDLFDGQAVTCDDFVHAMEQASGKDLTAFRQWYCQAGTPVCRVNASFNEENGELVLTITQENPAVASDDEKPPLYFPLAVAFLNREGNAVTIPDQACSPDDAATETVIAVSDREQTVVFNGITEPVVPSLLRGFSAPVKLEYDYSTDDLIFLYHHDNDPFSRFEAGQRLFHQVIDQQIDDIKAGRHSSIDSRIIAAFRQLLEESSTDDAFRALALSLPSLTAITDPMSICEFDLAFQAREAVITQLAVALEAVFKAVYECNRTVEPYSIDPAAIGKRSLKNLCLAYLSHSDPRYTETIYEQFSASNNMTDTLAALDLLCNLDTPLRQQALGKFYEDWHSDFLTMNKWFAVQAGSKLSGTYDDVVRLESNVVFDKENPNRLRALYGAFATNLIHFHHASGRGYQLIASKILEIDRFNPITAARLANAFAKYEKLDADRKVLMQKELEDLLKHDLSPAVYEIISKTLA